MKRIYLSGIMGSGKFVLVDDEDFEWLSQWKWNYDGKGYARRVQRIGLRKFNKKRVVQMHRLILGLVGKSRSIFTDHINGNTLDNRKINLRVATPQQSACNRGKDSRNKLGIKGVSWHKEKKKYRAYIFINKHQKHLGYFKIKEEALVVYNKNAEKYFGEFARLNQL